MGKSLNGKELGKGISQRKDGLYQARFVNRFGKRETIYAKTLNEIRHQLRTEQYDHAPREQSSLGHGCRRIRLILKLSLCVQAPNGQLNLIHAWLVANVDGVKMV